MGVWVELVSWLFWCDCWLRGLRLFSCYYIVCVGLVVWFVLCFVVVVLLLWVVSLSGFVWVWVLVFACGLDLVLAVIALVGVADYLVVLFTLCGVGL